MRAEGRFVKSSRPHHVPHRSCPPDGVEAYSWIVHISVSLTGSTTVAL